MGILDRFKRDRRPTPATGPAVPPTEKIGPAAPPTRKISTGDSTPPEPAAPVASEATVYTAGPSSRVVAVLIAIEGRLENEVYRIFDGPNRLGRASECEVVLPSQRISREHARIAHHDGVFRIEPLSDRNPTRVNGETTQGAELSDGDELRLGDTTFRFRTVG